MYVIYQGNRHTTQVMKQSYATMIWKYRLHDAHPARELWGMNISSFRVHGWGLLSQFPPFRYFPNFSALSKHTLYIDYHIYIWQISPQLSCGDTCQIWMWFKESNSYFCKVENFAYWEINERALVTTTPDLFARFITHHKTHIHQAMSIYSSKTMERFPTAWQQNVSYNISHQ